MEDNTMGDDTTVPMESESTENVADVPLEAEDDKTAGEGSTSDAAVNDGDEDRISTVPDEIDDEDDTKSTQNVPDEEVEDDEDIKSAGTAPEEEEETKSIAPDDSETAASVAVASPESTPSSAVEAPPPKKKKRGKPQIPASARKGRAPAVKGLNIPFRTVKKAMKLDPDIPIVQNEAAIMTTLAAELFLKRLANQSQKICKNRGKNTIRYEDVADARANDPSLAFLKTIIP